MSEGKQIITLKSEIEEEKTYIKHCMTVSAFYTVLYLLLFILFLSFDLYGPLKIYCTILTVLFGLGFFLMLLDLVWNFYTYKSLSEKTVKIDTDTYTDYSYWRSARHPVRYMHFARHKKYAFGGGYRDVLFIYSKKKKSRFNPELYDFGDEFYLLIYKGKRILRVYNTRFFELQE